MTDTEFIPQFSMEDVFRDLLKGVDYFPGEVGEEIVKQFVRGLMQAMTKAGYQGWDGPSRLMEKLEVYVREVKRD